MSYDHNAQQELNTKALENPQVGDYWHEMFCPYFLIVKVDGKKYTVLSCLGGPLSFNRRNELNARLNDDTGYWSFDYSKSMVVDRRWIENAVCYTSIDGFVADVVRGSEKNNTIVREWKQFHAQRLLKELKELGPEVSQMILQSEW